MRFTDLFIKRPVLATVISLLIFGFGLRALQQLPLRKFPKMTNGLLLVSTAYPGASAETVQSFITSPIEKAIASADGVDYLSSETKAGLSTIKIFLKTGYAMNEVFTNISAKVSETRRSLPEDIEPPIVLKSGDNDMSMMYVSFNSPSMSSQQISNYIQRIVQPRLETIDGLTRINIFGASNFALRIWLNPDKMAAARLTAEDVYTALKQNQYLARAGRIDGHYLNINLKAETDYHNVEEFKHLVIRQDIQDTIQLQDIARVELGATHYDHSVIYNGHKAVFISVEISPTANPLKVIREVKSELPLIEKQYPPSLHSKIVFDASQFIEKSIMEVIRSIVEATLIVLIVIFLFLGNLRAVAIPMITVPLSLVGVMSVMHALGYSINLLTLLAMVLAIGLVVDDAIVVLENIFRHLQTGLSRYEAACLGASEIASPVISMTLTLAAVYTPIAFTGGVTGALFKEFALTLAGSVVLSGFIALTLSPMMCAYFLKPQKSNRLEQWIQHTFDRLQHQYGLTLNRVIKYSKTMLLFILFCFIAIYGLLQVIPKDLAPTEDESFVFVSAQAPQYANLNYVEHYTKLFPKMFHQIPEIDSYFVVNQAHSAFAGVNLVAPEKRTLSSKDLQHVLQQAATKNPGLQTFAMAPSPLPISGSSLPIQFVISATIPHQQLALLVETIKTDAMKTGKFAFLNYNLEFNKPSYRIEINKSKAAQANIHMQQIASALSTFFSDNTINKIQLHNDSYDIIPQADHHYRLTPDAIKHVYVKNPSGKMIPLDAFISIHPTVEPNQLYKFQQLNAVVLSGIPAPGQSLAKSLQLIRHIAEEHAPSGTNFDYMGESRRFIKEGQTMLMTFVLALAVIFLVLSAQFESFIAPCIILVTVPLSMLGALGSLALLHQLPLLKSWHDASSLNIYSAIGLITLIGLITKHGILLVEFANTTRNDKKLSLIEATVLAAQTRLRPILMTTLAMILGVMPLLLAHGDGALSRISIGMVLVFGLAFGTALTLFVIPTLYVIVSRMRFSLTGFYKFIPSRFKIVTTS